MTRVLVAGIGNVLAGDDGFGPLVAQRLAGEHLPAGVVVTDFGIRGVDLAFSLLDGWDAAILVDLVKRGRPPGTLTVLEPSSTRDWARPMDGHGMDPASVLDFVAELGGRTPKLFLVGCEPAELPAEEDVLMGLSDPVARAVEPAISAVRELVTSLGGAV